MLLLLVKGSDFFDSKAGDILSIGCVNFLCLDERTWNRYVLDFVGNSLRSHSLHKWLCSSLESFNCIR